MTIEQMAFETVLQVGLALIMIAFTYIRIVLLTKRLERRIKESDLGTTATPDVWKIASGLFFPLSIAAIVLIALVVKALPFAF